MNWRQVRLWHLVMGLTAAGLVLVAYMAAPLLVTFDGHFYLVGSVVLFTPDAPDQYWWLRLPGYSVFLRGVRDAFGASDVALTLTQAIAIVVGSSLVAYVGIKQTAPRRQSQTIFIVVGSLIMGCGNAGVLMYASAVLQQALFLLEIGLVAFLAWGFRVNRSPWWLLAAAAALCSFGQIQKEFAYVALVAFLGVYVMGRRGDLMIQWRLREGALRRIARAVAIGLGGVLLINLSLLPWGHYRDQQIAQRSVSAPVLQEGFPPIIEQIATAAAFQEPHPWGFGSQFLALAGFEGDTIFVSKPVERYVYIARRFSQPGYPCGAVEDLPTGLESQFATSRAALTATCRPWSSGSLTRRYVDISLWVYPWILTSGVLLALIRLFVVRRRYIEIPLLVVIGSYGAIGFGADRYSVPAFPLAACVIIITFVDVGVFFRRAVRHRGNRGEQVWPAPASHLSEESERAPI
jgi:hypothetical protein